jgi:release factor glutamine methyltransferase
MWLERFRPDVLMFAKIRNHMRNSKELYSEIVQSIRITDDDDEKRSIAAVLMDALFGVSFTDIMRGEIVSFDANQSILQKSLERINTGEPVQYVTGFTYFLDKKFIVNSSVLIPRPETEELVLEVLRIHRHETRVLTIVDIGTGSGCIPISLALRLRAKVVGTDVSPDALAVAKQNSKVHGTDITFVQHDILENDLPFSNVDVLASNPPYIAMSEKNEMESTVLNFEPHLALFVEDERPLIFYERIAAEAARILSPGGLVVVEVNQRYAREVCDLFREAGLASPAVIKDISGNERIVKAFKNR